jgi:hypothetical protein
MTDKELDYLAEKIIELMFKKQEEYDAKLNDEINNNIYYFSTEYSSTFDRFNPNEKLKELESKLSNYINLEEYLKAEEISKQIKSLKIKYNLK